MKHYLTSLGAAALLAFSIVLMPAPAQAASLTEAQIQSIIDLVESFGADNSIVENVEASLRGTDSGDSDDDSDDDSSDDSDDDSDDSDNATSTQKNRLKIEAMLKMGSNGEDVKLLQKILASDPALYPEGLVTGFFGPLTELAVKRLQAKLKIDQVGAVGPQTLAKLNELLAGITSEDLANSRVKIEVKIKDGKEEIKFEIKCDSSGSGNTCKDSDEDEDVEDEEDDEDEDDDEDDSDDEDEEDEDEDD